jgi:hypothetical protein
MSSSRRYVATAAAVSALTLVAGLAVAQPTNTTLPGGWSWAPVPAMNGAYDTGLLGTPRGGFNTQTTPPFEDTSFGVMNESGTPWFTGSDLSAQQYVQRQRFGNFGTSGQTGRFFNSGFQSTAPGTNFPQTAAERRGITANHWNNPNPDAGGVASFGQVVYVPVSATLTLGTGYGADEMLLRIIGGNSGARSQFFVDGTLTANASTAAFGGLSNTSTIRVNAVVQANDAGAGNSYNTAWGFGATNNPGVNVGRVGGIDAVFVNGNFVQDPVQGIPVNSVGYSFSQSFNVLSTLVQTGGTFNVNWDATADINNLVRDSGNADARAQMGPGMEGTARLVVQWAAFQAIPTPGAAGLLALGRV